MGDISYGYLATMKRLISILNAQEAIAGFSALALQIVSYKLILMAGLGDAISVAISLTAFVALSGIGALAGGKVTPKYTAIIEGTLGLYALVVFGGLAVVDLGHVIVWLGGFSVIGKLVILLGVLAPLAVLPGTLIPLYEGQRNRLANKAPGKTAFIPVFIAFHGGGAVCLIAMETMLFPSVGWVITGGLLGVISLSNAILNTVIHRNLAVTNYDTHVRIDEFSKSKYWALFGLSVLTGFAGLMVYKAFDYLVGPNIRNYTVVTAFIFIGLSLAGILTNRFIKRFSGLIAFTTAGLVIFCAIVLALPHAIPAWVYATDAPWATYYLIAAVTMTPLFALIGMSIPGAVKLGAAGGKTLCIVSLGNAFGYWAYIIVASSNADLYIILGATLLIALIISYREPKIAIPVLLIGSWTVVLADHTAVHHEILDSRIKAEARFDAKLNEKRSVAPGDRLKKEVSVNLETEFYGAWNHLGWSVDHVALHRLEEGKVVRSTDWLYIGGFRSLTMFDQGKGVSWAPETVLSESMSCGVSVAFTSNQDLSLVLGAGTGTSASAVETMFRRTEIVDISSQALDQVVHFSNYNDEVYKRALLRQTDALALIADNARSERRFDYICNTLTGPGYAMSANMYSKEALEIISDSLSESGVYAFWVDGRSGSEGLRAIIQSTRETFKDVKILMLSPGTAMNRFQVGAKIPWNTDYQVIIASNADLHIQDAGLQKTWETLSDRGLEVSRTNMQKLLSIMEMELPARGDASGTGIETIRHAYSYGLGIEIFSSSYGEDLEN
jgi:spermidine synthase/FtsH-binding integral membrane protein